MTIEPWHWWVLGGALVVLEVFVPGFVLLWLGLAAMATGTLLWLAPGLSGPLQLLAFAALTSISVVGWFIWRRHHPPAPASPTLNRRAEQLVGEVYGLAEPIRRGRGKIRVGDSLWLVRGPDLPSGTTVRVVRAVGNTLEVEAAD